MYKNKDMNYSKQCVYLNKEIKKNNLLKLTWGNASVCNREKNHFFIKPSGIKLSRLTKNNISKLDLQNSKLLNGLKPSVDTPIHEELYKNFSWINSIIHTHSKFATAWAQSKMPIPILGTTHADYFEGDIPIVESVESNELDDYERNIGKKVCSTIRKNKNNLNAVLLEGHGVLVFSENYKKTLECAIVVEEVAEIAYYTHQLKSNNFSLTKKDLDTFKKHYDRKNSSDKYYGQ